MRSQPLKPWNLSALKFVAPIAPVHEAGQVQVVAEVAVEEVVPEPLVCSTAAAAAAWKAARAARRPTARYRAPGDVIKGSNVTRLGDDSARSHKLVEPCLTEVRKGDILVIFGDADSRETDAALGYFLDASFGKVTAIEGLKVHVSWLFTESYSAKLRPWYLQNGHEHTGILHESELFTGDTSSATPLKATVSRNKKLAQATKQAIIDVIGVDEFEKYI